MDAVRAMVTERGSLVQKETQKTSLVALEVAIDPEFFRQLEEKFKEISSGEWNEQIVSCSQTHRNHT